MNNNFPYSKVTKNGDRGAILILCSTLLGTLILLAAVAAEVGRLVITLSELRDNAQYAGEAALRSYQNEMNRPAGARTKTQHYTDAANFARGVAAEVINSNSIFGLGSATGVHFTTQNATVPTLYTSAANTPPSLQFRVCTPNAVTKLLECSEPNCSVAPELINTVRIQLSTQGRDFGLIFKMLSPILLRIISPTITVYFDAAWLTRPLGDEGIGPYLVVQPATW